MNISPVAVVDILNWLETIAPISRKMEWDNVGLLCGRHSKIVNKVLVALDPFENVAQEAVSLGADLILTHHPLIFKPAIAVTDDTAIGRTLLLLARNDIAALNAHTNLDIAPDGVNDVLARKLQLNNIQPCGKYDTDSCGRHWGLLRMGTVRQQSMPDFLGHVKASLHCPALRYADCGKPVQKVCVGGGSCASEFLQAVAAGCDTMVTSDIKYNDFRDAYDCGLNMIDAGHFFTEDPVCDLLVEKLQAAFPTLDVIKSPTHTDCMKFFV